MIVIKKIHSGRFGNKLLHYNNLVQIAKSLNISHLLPYHDDYKILNNKDIFVNKEYINSIIIDKEKLLNNKEEYLIELKELIKNNHTLVLEPCLGELFFLFDYNTREFYKDITHIKKDIYKNSKNCAIHFRGGDFKYWNPNSILSPEYYLNSIEHIKNNVDTFTIHTDDYNLDSFIVVKKYLSDNKILIEYVHESDNSFDNDYSDMLYSKYIISSPSTFAICSGIMGDEKEIIHSKKWVEQRVNNDDIFWVGVNNGGNNNYKINSLI